MPELVQEQEVWCSACGDILETCEQCGTPLSRAEAVLCVDHGAEHLCSQKCFEEWVKEEHHVTVAHVDRE